jgi:hypothetical protein
MKRLFAHFNYSLLCSIAYCIPVFFIFKNERYSNAWLLYLGNFCFAFLLLVSNIILKNKKSNPQTLQPILTSAFKMEIASILFSCIIILLLIFIFNASNAVKRAPVNILGFFYMLPLSAILINLAVGSFCVYLWAITSQEDENSA